MIQISSCFLNTIDAIRDNFDSYDSYAAVCLPKADKAQDDYNVVINPDEVYVFAIPKGSENINSVYTIINTLSGVSEYCYKYEFIDSLYTYFVRESGSIPYLGINSYNRIVPRILVFGDEQLIKEITDSF